MYVKTRSSFWHLCSINIPLCVKKTLIYWQDFPPHEDFLYYGLEVRNRECTFSKVCWRKSRRVRVRTVKIFRGIFERSERKCRDKIKVFFFNPKTHYIWKPVDFNLDGSNPACSCWGIRVLNFEIRLVWLSAFSDISVHFRKQLLFWKFMGFFQILHVGCAKLR